MTALITGRWIFLSLVLQLVSGTVIDDFRTVHLNNVGGVRAGVTVMLTYPRSGIDVPTVHEYLVETLAPHGHHLNLTDKALRVEYTAFTSGNRTLKFVPAGSGSLYSRVTPFAISVTLYKGRNMIDIPLSSVPQLSQAFAIGGPVFVHRLELIHSLTSDTAVDVLGSTASMFLNLYTPRRTEVPPRFGFLGFAMDQNNTIVRNLNLFRYRRDGVGVRKVQNGIEIMDGGFLYETLVSGTDVVNLRNKLVRITYSAGYPVVISIKLWYPAGGTDTVERCVRRGRKEVLDIPFSQFPGIRFRDGKSISIYGPITIHNLKLVNQNRGFQFAEITSGLLRNTWVVDDLTNWPAHTPGPSKMVIDWTQDLPGERVVDYQGVGRNNLDQPCAGREVSLARYGLRLSEHGSIYEQLSSPNIVYDLSHTHIEIEYSTKHQVTRQLRVLTLVPNDLDNDFHIVPALFDIEFLKGIQKSVQVDVGACGPSVAFRITGQGQVTLNRIRLHSTVPGHPDTLITITVDVFMDWPLLDNQVPALIPGQQTISNSRATTVFDYSQPDIQEMLILSANCGPVIGNGVEISDDGYLTHLLPTNIGTHVKISYSSAHIGTQRIVFVTKDETDAYEGIISEETMHVMFNAGQFLDAVFRVLPLRALVIAIRISGPLSVHRIEFSNDPWDVTQSPGQSASDALLIDDFSTQQNDTNIVNGERFTTGMSENDSVTLRTFDEYLVEGFAGEWKMNELAFRITYSADQTVTSLMTLISELLWGGLDTYEPSGPGAQEFGDMVLEGGVRREKVFRAWPLLRNLRDTSAPVSGIAIHGPITGVPLTIYRIELMGNSRYTQSIKPVTPIRLSDGTPGFEMKQRLFKRALKSLIHSGHFKISISRAQIWSEIYERVFNADLHNLRRKVKISFVGENGIDAGGLSREFFTLLATAINDPSYGLFTASKETNYVLQINPNSKVQGENHLGYFRLVGRIIGMALLNEKVLDIRLVPPLYKKLIEKPKFEQDELPDLMEQDSSDIDLSGIKEMDPELYKSMRLYLENDISEMTELTFELEWDNFGKKEVVELVKNGSRHLVTELNKRQYVREYVKWHTITKTKAQADALRDGVWDLIPRKTLSIFTEAELEVIIAGLPRIDLDDWIGNTIYGNKYTSDHPCVIMFWNCVRGWGHERQAKLLRFVTGSPRVPASGFARLKYRFKVSQTDESEPLPKASTCFNQIFLPPFTDPDVMCTRLVNVIESEMNEFAFN